MKKILIIVACLLCLTGCTKYKDYTELTYDELNKKLDNKETFVLVIGSSTCSACAQYKETMKDVIKDKQVEIFYLDLYKLNDEDRAKVDSKYSIKGTPSTLFIKEGKEDIYNRLGGAESYSTVIEKLKQHGFVGD